MERKSGAKEKSGAETKPEAKEKSEAKEEPGTKSGAEAKPGKNAKKNARRRAKMKARLKACPEAADDMEFRKYFQEVTKPEHTKEPETKKTINWSDIPEDVWSDFSDSEKELERKKAGAETGKKAGAEPGKKAEPEIEIDVRPEVEVKTEVKTEVEVKPESGLDILRKETENENNLMNNLESEFYFPPDFYGITRAETTDTRTAGEAFESLKRLALDPDTPMNDRFLAVRYMSRIPIAGRVKKVVETACEILRDERYSIHDRYFFFSNNEKLIHFDGWVVLPLHKFYYNNFPLPIIYKMLSAQYLLQYDTDFECRKGVTEYLCGLAEDKLMSINIRSEAADILLRFGDLHGHKIGEETIEELGTQYSDNKIKTIYSNAQNVHDSSVNKSYMEYLRSLTREFPPQESDTLDEIYELAKTSEKDLSPTLQRILIDTAKYEGLTLKDVAVMVWKKIKSCDAYPGDDRPIKATLSSGPLEAALHSELRKRYLEELSDMDGTCTSGYISRLLNVLSGFVPEKVISISVKEQLRNNIIARLNAELKNLSKKDKEQIILEMAAPAGNEKILLQEFVIEYSPREALYKEFCDNQSLIDPLDFAEIYEATIKEYCGI